MSFHHTLRMVQVPRQCTPSPAGEPMMTFCRVPPLAISNIGSWDSLCEPSPMQQYVFMPPSKVPETETVLEILTEPAEDGHEPVGVPGLPVGPVVGLVVAVGPVVGVEPPPYVSNSAIRGALDALVMSN